MLTNEQSTRLDDILREALNADGEAKCEGLVPGFINLKEAIQDSMTVVDIVCDIEEAFGIELPNTLEFGSVDDLRNEIGRLLQ